MNILVACEESQRVCISFREKGHNAFSCDILDCSGGHPEWHIKQDVLTILSPKIYTVMQDGKEIVTNITPMIMFKTVSGDIYNIPKWDLIIAHPPCTYLSNAGNGYFNIEKYGDKARERIKLREEAADFFMQFINADCDKICVENPVGYMNKHYRKPNQIVEPYFFIDSKDDVENYQKKRTCLWLKGLPELKKKNDFDPPEPIYIDTVTGKKRYYTDAIAGKSKMGQVLRSKTFWSVAKAMADQWG